VLFTGKDFVIIDFEGEPARPLSERRIKRSPLGDVAGMIRSFHYAAYSDLLRRVSVRPEDTALLEPWADVWHQYVSGVFLQSYLNTVGRAPFLPDGRGELEILLHAFILEKAVYELGYELNNRPDWVVIPIREIRDILKNPH
jgi:maltose alpha-D-glucosyltransferase/alpha-amylase